MFRRKSNAMSVGAAAPAALAAISMYRREACLLLIGPLAAVIVGTTPAWCYQALPEGHAQPAEFQAAWSPMLSRSAKRLMRERSLAALREAEVRTAVSAIDPPPSAVKLLLQAHIEYEAVPQVGAFAEKVACDPDIPCTAKNDLNRLIRVAHSPDMRQVVWKRMQRQEFLWLSGCQLRHIEALAADCDMPLRRPR